MKVVRVVFVYPLTCILGALLVHIERFLSLGVAINITGRDSLEAMKLFLISVYSAATRDTKDNSSIWHSHNHAHEQDVQVCPYNCI